MVSSPRRRLMLRALLLAGTAAVHGTTHCSIEQCITSFHQKVHRSKGTDDRLAACFGAPAAKCIRSGRPSSQVHEVLLRTLVAMMLNERGAIRPGGSVLDAGANNGQDSCWLAAVDHTRSVHALDPSRANIDRKSVV